MIAKIFFGTPQYSMGKRTQEFYWADGSSTHWKYVRCNSYLYMVMVVSPPSHWRNKDSDPLESCLPSLHLPLWWTLCRKQQRVIRSTRKEFCQIDLLQQTYYESCVALPTHKLDQHKHSRGTCVYQNIVCSAHPTYTLMDTPYQPVHHSYDWR